MNQVKPHYIEQDHDDYPMIQKGAQLATVHAANPQTAAFMLSAAADRSEWLWITLIDGTAIFGCFPRAITMEETEKDRMFPGIPVEPVHGDAFEGESTFRFVRSFTDGGRDFDLWVRPTQFGQQWRVRWGNGYADCATADGSEIDRHANISSVWKTASDVIVAWIKED